jgi:SAM-dependent MidA family methyltransferase
VSALLPLIRAEIAAGGPMRLDRYMALCLGHPAHGYYAARDPFGAAGDFVTAPEISQMPGELLGLWAAEVWAGMGAPAAVTLAELGPGRGALMADARRALAAAAPGFLAAARIVFVETSPLLRAAQARAVPGAAQVERVEALPEGPLIVLANEFFDALPIRQFVRAGGVWRERAVGLAGAGLAFGLIPAPEDGLPAGAPQGGLPAGAPEGAVVELCPAARSVGATLGARIAAAGGALLALDYGAIPPRRGGGDTLQALRAHAPADPLAAPGEADLTAHVDFGALGAAVAGAGARVWPLTTQGRFLEALGIGARAAALARARPDRAADIEGQRRRLTDPAAMGTLFKAFAATGPGQPPPPGFPPGDPA